jgi:hypothetical protein
MVFIDDVSLLSITPPPGTLLVNAFDEVSGTNITNFNVVVTNQVGTTFVAYGVNNTYNITTNFLPKGKNTIVTVYAPNYYPRSFTFDVYNNYFIVDGVYYSYVTCNAYLPFINNSHQYDLYVNNILGNPLEAVSITIKGLCANASYQTLFTGLTDGSGYTSTFLIPGRSYLVYLNKSGYQQSATFYIPSSTIFSHTFVMQFNETTPITYVKPIFTAYRTGTTIYTNYSDVMNQTLNARLYIYRVNSTTGNLTFEVLQWYNASSLFSYDLINTNTSCDYKVYLFYNHTSYGSQACLVVIEKLKTALTTPNKLNLLLTSIIGKAGAFLWQNVIMFICFAVMMFSIDKKDAGKGLMLIGGIFFFLSFIGFTDVFSATARSSIPVLFIIVGLILEWINSRRNR